MSYNATSKLCFSKKIYKSLTILKNFKHAHDIISWLQDPDLAFFFRAWMKIKKEPAPSSGLRNTLAFSCVCSQDFLLRAALQSPLFSCQLSSTGNFNSTLWAWSGIKKRDCTHNKKRQEGTTESGILLLCVLPKAIFLLLLIWMSFRTFWNYQMQSNRKKTHKRE